MPLSTRRSRNSRNLQDIQYGRPLSHDLYSTTSSRDLRGGASNVSSAKDESHEGETGGENDGKDGGDDNDDGGENGGDNDGKDGDDDNDDEGDQVPDVNKEDSSDVELNLQPLRHRPSNKSITDLDSSGSDSYKPDTKPTRIPHSKRRSRKTSKENAQASVKETDPKLTSLLKVASASAKESENRESHSSVKPALKPAQVLGKSHSPKQPRMAALLKESSSQSTKPAKLELMEPIKTSIAPPIRRLGLSKRVSIPLHAHLYPASK